MRGELDDIFNKYKQNKSFKPEKKISSQGVPDPILDGENGSNTSDIRSCHKCGSLNISLDMSTSQMVCRECGEKPNETTRLDFQKMMEKVQEEEQANIIDCIKRGDTFLI